MNDTHDTPNDSGNEPGNQVGHDTGSDTDTVGDAAQVPDGVTSADAGSDMTAEPPVDTLPDAAPMVESDGAEAPADRVPAPAEVTSPPLAPVEAAPGIAGEEAKASKPSKSGKSAKAAKPAKAPKVPKDRVVHDDVKLLQSELDLIKALKQRLSEGRGKRSTVRKSDLLRAGLRSLAAGDDEALRGAIAGLPPLKAKTVKRSKGRR